LFIVSPANLVNEAFAIEEVGRSKESFAFRSRPRINPELLSKELENSQGTKWIVMETPCPVIYLYIIDICNECSRAPPNDYIYTLVLFFKKSLPK
jgi:hypothetical protein